MHCLSRYIAQVGMLNQCRTRGAARYGNGDVTREERSSVSEDARSCNILDEAALRVQGCEAKQEPSVKSQVARVRTFTVYLQVCK